MINFRYHVVSLTAVFLALAIGLVVGTAALNGPAADSLSDQVNSLGKANGNLRDQVIHLREDAGRKEDFLRLAAPKIIGGALTNRRVLVLTLPGGREHAEGVRAMLAVAGARVTGQIDVEDKFIDPANGIELLDLADKALPPTVAAATLPGNSDGVEKSSALLAAALLDRVPAVALNDLRSVLAAYQDTGYLSTSAAPSGPAEVVVVVSDLPPTDNNAQAENKNTLTLVAQFDRAGRIVVGGGGVGAGNVVEAVRADPTLSKTISTVDNADTAQGQLVTAMAVGGQLVGVAGQYGVGAGAQGLMPKAAP
ncbi:copper transporter [Pilimelia columellifera]|uniref:Copper transporter n=1 Tax=Pilimelia columellifera subsp. columellifera TaxID=706583 RepID=A0ABP6B0R1_9ACTN